MLLNKILAFSFDEKFFMSRVNQQKMFDFIESWQQSGLSQKAWCERNSIPYSSFHYWYRRFRNRHGNPGGGEGFVQLLVKDNPSGRPWCELVLRDGKRICFHQPVAVV